MHYPQKNWYECKVCGIETCQHPVMKMCSACYSRFARNRRIEEEEKARFDDYVDEE